MPLLQGCLLESRAGVPPAADVQCTATERDTLLMEAPAEASIPEQRLPESTCSAVACDGVAESIAAWDSEEYEILMDVQREFSDFREAQAKRLGRRYASPVWAASMSTVSVQLRLSKSAG